MAFYIERVEVSVVPTEPTSSGCYLKINTFFDPAANPITIECNGITYVSGIDFTMAAYGHAFSGDVFIPDLVDLKHYTWTVTQNNFKDEGWVNRLPKVGEEHTVVIYSCDNNTNLTNKFNKNPIKATGMWKKIKSLIDSGKFISMIVGVDDFTGYVDYKKISDTFEDASGYEALNSAQNSTLATDVSLAYMSYLGCTGGSRHLLEGEIVSNDDLTAHWAREEYRAYVRNRIPRKVVAGDHEYEPDIGYITNVQDGNNPRWVDYTLKTPGQSHIAYETMVNVPSARTICNGGVNDPDAIHWTITAGNIKFVAFDQATHCDGSARGGNSVPSQQANIIYGTPQLMDIKAEVVTDPSKFSVMLFPSGLMYGGDGVTSLNGHLAQYPLYNLCTAEWEFLFTNDVDGLATSKWFNGAFGTGFAISGDLHRRNTLRYQNKPYAGNVGIDLEHWHTGTVNGSSNFGNFTNLNVGDVFESVDGIATLELLEDEDTKLAGGNDFSFMYIEDLAKGNPRLRVTHVKTDETISYQREYGIGHGNLSHETFPKQNTSPISNLT